MAHPAQGAGSSSTNRARLSSPDLIPTCIRDDPRRDLLHRDRPLVPSAAHERGQPLHQRGPPVLEARQERQVDERPHQPADEPADLQALEADDRAKARDRRHAAEIAVAKRLGPHSVVALHAPFDRAGGVDARLHRHLRDPREPVQRHHVADHEHLRMAGQGAVGQHCTCPARSVPAPVAAASISPSGEA